MMSKPTIRLLLFSIVLLICTYNGVSAQWNLVAPNLLGKQDFGMGAIIHKSGVVWAGTHEVWMSRDSGSTWTKRSPLIFPNDYIDDINFFDFMIGIVSTHNGSVYRTLDQGMTWTEIHRSASALNATFLSTPDHILIATGAGGVIDATQDGGLTWKAAPLANLVPAVRPLIGGGAYALAGNAARGIGSLSLFKTTDYGNTWTSQPGTVDFDTWSFDVNPCEPNQVFVVNEGCNNSVIDKQAEILVSSDAGASWVSKDSHPISPGISNYYFCGSLVLIGKTLFAQTVNNGVVRSTDKGISWKIIGGPSATFDTRLVAPINGNIILAVDNNGSIYKTSNSGGDSLTNISPYEDLSIFPYELFTPDTLANCDTPVVRSIVFASLLCSQPKIDTQYIIGTDSADYTIVKGIADSLSSLDTVLLSFRPHSSGPQNGYYVLVLKDGTQFITPLHGYGKGITYVEPFTNYVRVDTIGGTANVPIRLNGFPVSENVELIIHYDTRMRYTGSFSIAGTILDLPGEQWLGRSKIRITKSELQLDTNSGFATFTVFPDGEDCFIVSLDSLEILNKAAPCLYAIGNGIPKYVCPPRGCGIMTITNYMLKGVFPQLFIQPNPNHGTFTVIASDPIGESTLSLYDMLGTEISTSYQTIKAGTNSVSFNQLRSGSYYLRIESATVRTTVPIVIIE